MLDACRPWHCVGLYTNVVGSAATISGPLGSVPSGLAHHSAPGSVLPLSYLADNGQQTPRHIFAGMSNTPIRGSAGEVAVVASTAAYRGLIDRLKRSYNRMLWMALRRKAAYLPGC
jgi:hypothetical protein